MLNFIAIACCILLNVFQFLPIAWYLFLHLSESVLVELIADGLEELVADEIGLQYQLLHTLVN